MPKPTINEVKLAGTYEKISSFNILTKDPCSPIQTWLEVFGNKAETVDFPVGFDFRIERQQTERNYKAGPSIFFLLWHINKHRTSKR